MGFFKNLGNGIKNIGNQGFKLTKKIIINPVTHPVKTINTIADTGLGIVDKVANTGIGIANRTATSGIDLIGKAGKTAGSITGGILKQGTGALTGVLSSISMPLLIGGGLVLVFVLTKK